MDSDNIVRRRLGLAMAKGYLRWQTNRPPSEYHEWYKPYFYSQATLHQARLLLGECASLIATMADPPEKDLLRSYVAKYCELETDWQRQLFGL
jgi:hypothetical protein